MIRGLKMWLFIVFAIIAVAVAYVYSPLLPKDIRIWIGILAVIYAIYDIIKRFVNAKVKTQKTITIAIAVAIIAGVLIYLFPTPFLYFP